MFESLSKIKSGDNVEVVASAGMKTARFNSTIVEVREDALLLEPIQHNGSYVGFQNPAIIKNIYVHTDKIPIRFLNVDIKLINQDGTRCHAVPIVSEGIATNRRDAYRLYIGENVYAQIGENRKSESVTLKDISVSGFAIVARDDVDVKINEDLVRVLYNFKEENKKIALNGTVVRKEMINNRVVYGCQSLHYSPLVERIIAKKQRQMIYDKIRN